MRRSTAVVAAAVLGAAPLLAASPAEGLVRIHRNYAVTRTFHSVPLKTCYDTTISGQVAARASAYKGSGPNTVYSWSHGLLTNPRIRVEAYDCRTGYGRTQSKISVKQAWIERTCSLDPSIGAGFPWSLAVSATVTCGREKAGTRRTTYGRSTVVTQNNSGSPVSFSGTRFALKICFAANATVTAYQGSTSDTFQHSDLRACIDP